VSKLQQTKGGTFFGDSVVSSVLCQEIA